MNETVEIIGTLMVSAIEQLQKSRTRPEEHAFLGYLQKKGNGINQQTLLLRIVSISKNDIILKKPLSCKTSYSVKPFIETEQIAATPTPLSNPTTPLSSAPKESRVFVKSNNDFRIEQIEN